MIHLILHNSSKVRAQLQEFEYAIQPFKIHTMECRVDNPTKTLELLIERGYNNTLPAIVSIIAVDWFQESLIKFSVEY